MVEPPALFSDHLKAGEGQYVEFKSAFHGKPGNRRKRPVKDIKKVIAETLISFANAEGGVLYVGVEDDRTVDGIPHDEAEIAELKTGFIQLIQDSRNFPLHSAYAFRYDKKCVLAYEIKNFRAQPFQLTDGRCLKRVSDENKPFSVVEISRTREEDDSREFDRRVCAGASEKDIDWDCVERIASRCYPNSSMSARDFLRAQGLAEYGVNAMVFRNACLLLFGLKERLPALFPKSSVRLIQVDGDKLHAGKNYNVLRQEEYRGNIFHLLEDRWQNYSNFLSQGESFGQNMRFENNPILPDLITRECLVNALAHRCYNTASDIKIYRYAHAVEFENPGRLLSHLSLEEMYRDDHLQSTRNILIARTLRQSGIMRELGEGLRRIKEEARIRAISPLFCSNHNYFSITLVLSASSLEALTRDMDRIVEELRKENTPGAGNLMRNLIQSGFYGIEEMDTPLADRFDTILRATAAYPNLHDERRGFSRWAKDKGRRQHGH